MARTRARTAKRQESTTPIDPKTGLRIEPSEEEQELKRLQRERDAPFKVIVSIGLSIFKGFTRSSMTVRAAHCAHFGGSTG